MKVRLGQFIPLMALLLVPLPDLELSGQEADKEPIEKSRRDSSRGMDPAERLKRMLEFFDGNKDGILTREEFKGDSERFKRMDANGDGKVGPKELEAVRERMQKFGGRRPGLGSGFSRQRGDDNSPPVGRVAPDFSLQLLGKKEKVTLSGQYREKPVVLTFGSYTCPPFRRALEAMEDGYQAPKEDCNFLFVYVREAHAIDGRVSHANTVQGIEIKQHKTYGERASAAKTCQGKLEITMPILIDSLDNATGMQYGGVPNRAYLIDKGGKVIYKGERGPMGTRPDQVKAAIKALLGK